MGWNAFTIGLGRKFGLFGGRAAAEAERAHAAARAAARNACTASDIERAIWEADVSVEDLKVDFDGRTARLTGTVRSERHLEKAAVVAQAHERVARVDDQLRLLVPAKVLACADAARALAELGRLEEAGRWVREGLRLGLELRNRRALARVEAAWAYLLGRQGRWEEAAALYAGAEDRLQRGPVGTLNRLRLERVEFELLRGQPAEALAILDRAEPSLRARNHQAGVARAEALRARAEAEASPRASVRPVDEIGAHRGSGPQGASMGLIDFTVGVGRKLGLFGGRAAAEAEQAKAEALAAVEKAKTASEAAARKSMELAAVALDIKAAILSYVAIDHLDVDFDGRKVRLAGTARSQADKEKAVLVAGNTESVAQVDDQLAVVVPEPPAVYHTVVTGDSLSAIAGRYYGVIGLYDAIFQANQPMLSDPDEIYPGQVLRIPPVEAPIHVVARGETLGTIAKRWYGDAGRYKELAAANHLANPDAIDVGQSLTIPLVNPLVG